LSRVWGAACLALALAIAAAVWARSASGQPGPIDFAMVQARAQQLASSPYKPADPAALPGELQQLGYDSYQAIRFRPERSLLQAEGGLFRAQLFAAGFLFREPVSIHLVGREAAQPISAGPELFEWSQANLKKSPPTNVPLAGFRLHFPLHGTAPVDEIAAFLGASYYRLIGRGQVYGTSARGLAIDTGLAREEFPAFREFWLVSPPPDDAAMTVYALLDSPSVAGAYRFVLRPGARTVADVTAVLHARKDIGLLGVAPLTSMFLSGELSGRRGIDYRPEVHDADGLLIETGAGEHLWRPLSNPQQLATSVFAGTPHGFGLLQRDRNFDHYQDLQAQYHRRPGFWVRPKGDWGDGAIRLIEIPSPSEIHDNIVAFWTPRTPLKAGTRVEYSYTIAALSDDDRLSPRGRVVATRQTTAAASGLAPPKPNARRMVVDFAGPDLTGLSVDQPITGDVSVSSGRLGEVRVEPVPPLDLWRLVFDVEPEGTKPVELRAFLRLRGEPLTETWSYRWQP
jgi:glucans biosynthesis protein